MPNQYTYSSDQEQFDTHVDKSAGDDACWIWTGHCEKKRGYGQIGWHGKSMKAHRVAFLLANGFLPDDLEVCHSCDNPPCVNPKHLWLGTHQENVDDRERKGRNIVPKGEKHGRHKLTETQVKEIRQIYARGGISMEKLGAQYDVSKVTVCNIVNHYHWDEANRRQRGHERGGKGEKAGNHKLTETQVREIRFLYAQGDISHQKIADRYGMTKTQIGDIIRRKSWSHIP